MELTPQSQRSIAVHAFVGTVVIPAKGLTRELSDLALARAWREVQDECITSIESPMVHADDLISVLDNMELEVALLRRQVEAAVILTGAE